MCNTPHYAVLQAKMLIRWLKESCCRAYLGGIVRAADSFEHLNALQLPLVAGIKGVQQVAVQALNLLLTLLHCINNHRPHEMVSNVCFSCILCWGLAAVGCNFGPRLQRPCGCLCNQSLQAAQHLEKKGFLGLQGSLHRHEQQNSAEVLRAPPFQDKQHRLCKLNQCHTFSSSSSVAAFSSVSYVCNDATAGSVSGDLCGKCAVEGQGPHGSGVLIPMPNL